MRENKPPHINIVLAQIQPTSFVGCGSGPHAAWNDGPWVAHSCLPDLGHKQAIAMPHVSQEQRNKPELDTRTGLYLSL